MPEEEWEAKKLADLRETAEVLFRVSRPTQSSRGDPVSSRKRLHAFLFLPGELLLMVPTYMSAR